MVMLASLCQRLKIKKRLPAVLKVSQFFGVEAKQICFSLNLTYVLIDLYFHVNLSGQ